MHGRIAKQAHARAEIVVRRRRCYQLIEMGVPLAHGRLPTAPERGANAGRFSLTTRGLEGPIQALFGPLYSGI
jgi:hypothetical protein